MKCSNNMGVVRTAQSDRHPCCSLGFILCSSNTQASIKQTILLMVRFITTFVRKQFQRPETRTNGADPDRTIWGLRSGSTLFALHFLTKLRDAIYEICDESICLNKCTINMGVARTAIVLSDRHPC